uniref:PiggyBac transposable element-derived protein domain-containing protein n=1 Tax=Clastoptera arizonana TaxID=38151 RepID=A0A1B6E7C5_9HEMI
MPEFLLTEDNFLSALNKFSEGDIERSCLAEEDQVEFEEISDGYDSDPDLDYVPDEDDLLQEDNNTLEAIKEIEASQFVSTPSASKRVKRNRPRISKVLNNKAVQDGDKIVCQIDGEDGIVVANNGFLWETECNTSVAGKTPTKNVVHIRAGPSSTARQAYSPLECFQLFFDPEIVGIVLQCTNEEIELQKKNYKNKNFDGTVKELCLEELNALFGLIILAAALKDNHLNTTLMFDNTFCGDRYKATMSERRFKFLINCLRFDNKTTREDRQKTDKFSAITDIWKILLKNCRSSYKPSKYLTIDEQLVGFRGRCPFRMYIPSKPNKYGIKILMMCDNSTKYMVDARVHLGKGSVPKNISSAEFYVNELISSIEMSNRNITMDKWFTSVPLIQNLLIKKKLSVVGAVKNNKPELPSEFVDKKYKNRKIGTSAFLFRDDMTAVSYKLNANKIVCLLSSMHHDNTISNSGKPKILMVYNETKGAVDSFDQMCHNMNCHRKTQRWPMCIFYNMMNISIINAYVVFAHNAVRNSRGMWKLMSRQDFLLELHKQLTKPWQERRMIQQNISRNLKRSIGTVLGAKTGWPNILPPPQPDQKGERRYCSFCDCKKRRMTTTYCSCGKAICGEYLTNMYPMCNKIGIILFCM